MKYQIVRLWPDLWPDRLDAIYIGLPKEEAEELAEQFNDSARARGVRCVYKVQEDG